MFAEFNPILAQPTPDFDEFRRVILGQQEPKRVHLVEFIIDQEVMQAITERYLGRKWIPITGDSTGSDLKSGVWVSAVPPESYYAQIVELYYRLGYDCLVTWPIWDNHPAPFRRRSEDTAILSRGQREWAENTLLITSRAEFEQFPWDRIQLNVTPFHLTARHLPSGMKMMVGNSLLDHILKNMVGHESLLYMIADQPDLVAEILARWGKILYDGFESVIDMDKIGGICVGDDYGHKTGTIVSPRFLRRHVLPWLKKYAELAHAHGKMFWLHSCGNIFKDIIEDLIDDVRIDAFHSFQDVILPVAEFQARYGHRVGTLGGVDIDNLARMKEPDLRAYIRSILDRCMPSGRYALGTGNSVVNYIPLENYFVLLDEARRWRTR